MQKYNEARRERTEAARNVLQDRAHAAADTLATIMQDADAPAQTRVSAAAEILRQTVKYTEITDIMQQLDEGNIVERAMAFFEENNLDPEDLETLDVEKLTSHPYAKN